MSSPRTALAVRWRGGMPGLLALALLAVFAGNAAAMSIRELRALAVSDENHGEAYVQYYLVGAMEGALEAHAHAVRAGARPMVCLNGRRLEPRMAKPLYDGELVRNKGLYEADMPVQLVLVNALTSAYAC
jgi:hypothetical protein